MDPDKQYKEIIKQTSILKNPKHRLATFGQTKINYLFLSEVTGFKDRSRMREGLVVAENPKIITPDLLKNRFSGFGKGAKEFNEWLKAYYGEAFRGLEYKFRNDVKIARVEYHSLKVLSEQIKDKLKSDQFDQYALIQGPDKTWQISLMKFIVDECMASFSDNLRELDEHGYFDDPDKAFKDVKKEIEKLFLRAKKDPSILPSLGRKLRKYGLFKEYEDRFFGLLK